jgi:hypothetical protein
MRLGLLASSHLAQLWTGRRPKGSDWMNMMACALDVAFRTTLLLTGTINTAEEAVMRGIDAGEDLSPRALLIEAVRSAVRLPMESQNRHCEVEYLPPELQRLFMLQPLPRRCFVLRLLVGLSSEFCADLLDISVCEFEEALQAAFIELGSTKG